MVHLDFEPHAKGDLNELYQKLENSINKMNLANDFQTLNYWSVCAMFAIMEIYKINSTVIDWNSMGK